MVRIVDSPSQPSAWRRLLEAGVVAGLAFLAVVPYLHYLTRVAFSDVAKRRFAGVPLTRVLEADLALVGVLVAICAVSGSLLARRYGLAGLGSVGQLRAAQRWTVPGGAGLCVVTYLLFGRHLARRVPGYYPASIGWAAVVLVKGMLFDETVARFGVMTILAGAVRRAWIANLLQAALFTWLTLRGLPFFGIELQWSGELGASLVASVLAHLGQGWVYCRYGLITSSSMHGLVDLKYPLHALLTL